MAFAMSGHSRITNCFRPLKQIKLAFPAHHFRAIVEYQKNLSDWSHWGFLVFRVVSSACLGNIRLTQPVNASYLTTKGETERPGRFHKIIRQ
jgi:hypothetical protein